MNKNPDNINRYLSSLRRFASLDEILQNHEKGVTKQSNAVTSNE